MIPYTPSLSYSISQVLNIHYEPQTSVDLPTSLRSILGYPHHLLPPLFSRMPSLARRVKTLTLDPQELFTVTDPPSSNFGSSVFDYTIADPDCPFGLLPPSTLELLRRFLKIDKFSFEELMSSVHERNIALVESELGSERLAKCLDDAWDVDHPSQIFEFLGLVFGTPKL